MLNIYNTHLIFSFTLHTWLTRAHFSYQQCGRTNMPAKGILSSYTPHQHRYQWGSCCGTQVLREWEGAENHTQPGPQCCRVESAEWALWKWFLTSKLNLFGTKGTEGHFHAVSQCNFCCPMSETCNSSLKGHPDPNCIASKRWHCTWENVDISKFPKPL